MNLKDTLKTSGLVEKYNLTFRGPIDLVDIPDKSDLDDSIWNQTAKIVALPGQNDPSSRHFCKLIGEVPGYNSPQPGKHVAYEIYRKGVETTLSTNRKLDPKNLKAGTRIDGICFLMLSKPQSQFKDSTLPVGSIKQRASEEDMLTLGQAEGPSIQMDPESGTVKIVTKKESFNFGASMDLGNSHIFGNFGDFESFFTMPNPIRKYIGITLPDTLPFTPLTFEPFPNIPNIAFTYIKATRIKDQLTALKNLADEITAARQAQNT